MKLATNQKIETSKWTESPTVPLSKTELRQALVTAIEFEIVRLEKQTEMPEVRQKVDYLSELLHNMNANKNWKGPRLMSKAELLASEENE